MNWDAIGAIGEIIGALGVVASLFYVAYQVKQNTAQSKFNTDTVSTASAEAVSRAVNEVRLKVAENEALAHIYTVGLEDPESLSKEELTRFRVLLASMFHLAQIVFEASSREINRDQWIPARNNISRLMSSPGGKWVWDNFSADFTDEFQQEVERMKDELEFHEDET